MRISCSQLPIGRDEIARHVDLAALPPGTDVRAFVVAHEGESRPINPDTGQVKALWWGRAAVQRVAQLARRGLQFVRSHQDHTPVGEVLGSWTAEVAGRLRAIVAAQFQPQAAEGADVCSIEADGVQERAGTVTAVGTLDRIALGNSRHDSPGFPGAVLSGAIYAFSEGVDTGAQGGEPNSVAEPQQRAITIRDVRSWLEDNPGIQPHQLFSDDAILAHKAVAAKVDEVGAKLTKSEAKVAELTGTISRGKAQKAVETKVAESNWTPEAKAYAAALFEGWGEASDNPAKVTEWVTAAAERFKTATGKDAAAPKQEGQQQTAQQTTVGAPVQTQPNQPPAGQPAADPVASAMQTLGIATKQEAA